MDKQQEEYEKLKESLDEKSIKQKTEDEQLAYKVRMAECNIPEKLLLTRTFQNFKTDCLRNGNEIVSKIKEFISVDYNKDGIKPYFYTLHGLTGLGKSHIAIACVGECIKTRSAIYWHAPKLLYYLRKCDFDKTIFDVMDVLMSVDFLVIDDYGDFKVTEYKSEQLDIIINHRYDYDKLTLVTTNIYLKNLFTINPRIASRLMDGYHSKFEGNDHRIETTNLRKVGN